MSTILDFYGPHDAQTYLCFRAGGAVGIGRYLTDSANDPRQITPQEVSYAHAAGLAIHLFFEMNPVVAAYFTFAQGAHDCQQAQARLAELGAPDGQVVYFAVDAPPSVIPVDVLDEYFNGVESVVTPRITPGMYGFEAHCDYARTRFPNVGKHLAQTYGTVNGALDIWQHLQEDRCGVSVDVDEAYIAGWQGVEMTPTEVNAAIDAKIAAYGVALQAELDANYVLKTDPEKPHPHTAITTIS